MEDDVKDFIALITAGELDDELIDIEQAILRRRLELGVNVREVAAAHSHEFGVPYLRTGDRVRLKGIRPRYLNGLEITVKKVNRHEYLSSLATAPIADGRYRVRWDGRAAHWQRVPVSAQTHSDQSITCTCAAIPPTMPTYRDRHLSDCPVEVFERGVQAGRAAAMAGLNRRYIELHPETLVASTINALCEEHGHLRLNSLGGRCARCGDGSHESRISRPSSART